MQQINQEDFQRLVQFIKDNYGINLTQKKLLIESRLGNVITSMGFQSFAEYVEHILKNKDSEDLNIMLNRLTTNHTYFMREVNHFDYFRDTILPYLEQSCTSRTLGVWSAGCSSGEEPYTLSMLLMDYFGSKRPSWDTRVLATDISHRALKLATDGVYTEEELKDLPARWRQTYFRKQESNYTVTPQLKQNVIFREFNLMDSIRFKSRFDVIFCRNVMIYFDLPTKEALVRRFHDVMNPGGYLLIGHSETLNHTNQPFQYIMPAVYRKKL